MMRRAIAAVMRSSKVAATAVGVVATLLLISVLGCSASLSGKLLNGGVTGSASADYLTTRSAINSGKAHEWNALAGNGAIREALVKFAGASFVIGSAAYLEKKEQKVLAQVIRSAAIVAWSAIAYRNSRLVR